MKTEELLNKLNKLDYIYDVMNAEIEAYDIYIRKSIYDNWKKRKQKIQLNLINRFKKEAYSDTEADGIVFCGKCGKMK